MDWSDRGTRLFAHCVVMAVFSSVAVALRFISRGRILHVLGPSDWFLALTLLFSIANTASVGAHVSNGLGWPVDELTLEEQRGSLRVQYIAIIINNLSLVLTKISVTLLFLDFSVIAWFRKATYVILGMLILYGLMLTTTNIFVCSPIQAYWDPKTSSSRCLDTLLKFYLDNGLNFLADVLLLLLPVPLIWPMSLPWRQKLWLGFLFVLGLSACTLSVLRSVLARDDVVDSDYSVAAVRIVYWAVLEVNLSIIIACVPTLAPLAAKLWPGLVVTPRTNDSADGRPPTISSAPIRLRSVENIGG